MAVEKEKKSCGQVMAEWRQFIWDPRTHQFMGRTGTSWGRAPGALGALGRWGQALLLLWVGWGLAGGDILQAGEEMQGARGQIRGKRGCWADVGLWRGPGGSYRLWGSR